jgi:hypothetical protein
MARSTSWMPLALGVVLVGAVIAAAQLASERVDRGLRGVAQLVPTPPDAGEPDEAGPALYAEIAPEEEPFDPDEPRLDLEYPTERDWVFLEQVMREGEPSARRSAAKALVVMGRMRGVPLLFDAAREPGADADLFCMAALDVLRLQRREDALPALLQVMLDEEQPPSHTCRSEVSDRFAVAGGRDPERLAVLADHEDPRIRGFVASYLLEVDPHGQRKVLDRLAADEVPEVAARAGAASSDPGSARPPSQE